jgi:hypothetical protein
MYKNTLYRYELEDQYVLLEERYKTLTSMIDTNDDEDTYFKLEQTRDEIATQMDSLEFTLYFDPSY